MPDNDTGDGIKEQPVEHNPHIQSSNSLPDDPASAATQPISNSSVQAEVKELEDRVKRAEWWMIGLTAAIAFFGLCAVIVGVLQWSAMHGQLREMKSSAKDTHALAEAAVASNRPWVGIGGIPTVRQQSGRWYIASSVKNFGNSPVLNAIPSSGVENVTTTEEVNEAVKQHCTHAEGGQDSSGPSGEQGYVLFPGKSAQLQPVSVPNNLQNILSFIGCVSYFDQFGKRPSTTPVFATSLRFPL